MSGIPPKSASTTAVTTDSDVHAQLSAVSQDQTTQEQEINIFTASQRGDLALVKQLVESGQATVNDRDPQNISPLHWASINAHLALCRWLLEQGAEVDVIGGELMATPLQWSARYLIINLVIHKANCTIGMATYMFCISCCHTMPTQRLKIPKATTHSSS